ncbi:hypothetical protein KUTeg_008954 [Tegillarca granosa]|uniref:Uncharacterized protein n=1 Tax=Tegillarca granosa TaxID=220873 RepID=A0ABQ9FAM6_TEGGR|nr:hypothetical protein KUTeg_008954 [Tegillarca granosa]
MALGSRLKPHITVKLPEFRNVTKMMLNFHIAGSSIFIKVLFRRRDGTEGYNTVTHTGTSGPFDINFSPPVETDKMAIYMDNSIMGLTRTPPMFVYTCTYVSPTTTSVTSPTVTSPTTPSATPTSLVEDLG